MKMINNLKIIMMSILLFFTGYSIIMTVVLNQNGFSEKFEIENIYLMLSLTLCIIDYFYLKNILKAK
jgi:hypothetical protein